MVGDLGLMGVVVFGAKSEVSGYSWTGAFGCTGSCSGGEICKTVGFQQCIVLHLLPHQPKHQHPDPPILLQPGRPRQHRQIQESEALVVVLRVANVCVQSIHAVRSVSIVAELAMRV